MCIRYQKCSVNGCCINILIEIILRSAKCVQRIPLMWICFETKDALQSGSITVFKFGMVTDEIGVYS